MTAPLRNRDASANHAFSLETEAAVLGPPPPGVGGGVLVIRTGKQECRTVARGMVAANNRGSMHVSRLLALALALAACRDATGKQSPPAAPPVAAGSGSGSGSAKMFIPQQKPPDSPPGRSRNDDDGRVQDRHVALEGRRRLRRRKTGRLSDVRRAPDRAQADVGQGQGLADKPPGCPIRSARAGAGRSSASTSSTITCARSASIRRRSRDPRLRAEALADDRADRQRSHVEGRRRLHVPVRRRASAASRSRRCPTTSATASRPTRSRR